MFRHSLFFGAFLAAVFVSAGLLVQVDTPVARAQTQSVYGDGERGRELFRQRCGSCHEIEDSWGRPQDAPISAEEMARNSRMSLDYLTTVQAGAGPVHASLPPFFFDSQQEEDLQAFFESLQ